MTALLDHLLLLPPGLAYGLIGVLVFAEAAVFVGFVLPGETAVLLGGVLASTGRLSLPVLLVLVVLAAVGGDSVGYEVGRRFGPRLLGGRLLRRHRARVDDASAVLRRRGGWAVLLARSTAFLRAVMPGLAGLSRMPYRRFLAFNAAGRAAVGHRCGPAGRRGRQLLRARGEAARPGQRDAAGAAGGGGGAGAAPAPPPPRHRRAHQPAWNSSRFGVPVTLPETALRVVYDTR